MKRLLPLALLLALPACNLTPPVSPGAVADKTTLDEKAAIAITVSYTTASRLGNRLARAGIIPLAKFQAADNAAFGAVKAVRSAYEAGNAADYATAITKANDAITAIKELV